MWFEHRRELTHVAQRRLCHSLGSRLALLQSRRIFRGFSVIENGAPQLRKGSNPFDSRSR